MSTLTRWRRHAGRYGRDLTKAMPGGKIGLAVVGGLGAFFGYKRYYQVKVGDTVVAMVAPVPGGPQSSVNCKVLAIDGSGNLTVAPIIGGVQTPASTVIPPVAVVQNLTPRLF
jgi:hypothetical protein